MKYCHTLFHGTTDFSDLYKSYSIFILFFLIILDGLFVTLLFLFPQFHTDITPKLFAAMSIPKYMRSHLMSTVCRGNVFSYCSCSEANID